MFRYILALIFYHLLKSKGKQKPQESLFQNYEFVFID